MRVRWQLGIAVLWLMGALVAQAGVRLTRLPERIALPAPAGSNLLLEAEVEVDTAAGGKVGDVWLATAAAAAKRVALHPVGAARYQLNLADAEVSRLLPADRERGELRVFAEVSGRVRQSAPIAWVRAEPRVDPTCTVVGTDGTRTELRIGRTRWIDPSAVERIELRGLDLPQARVLALGDAVVLPFARRAPDQPFTLRCNDGVRRSLAGLDAFGIEALHGQRRWWFGLRCVPHRLTPRAPQFTMVQRTRQALPGSNGWLFVRIGDITMGQVLLTVRDARGREVVPQRSFGEGDYATISLAGGDYVLAVDRLVNLLVGDDTAVLRIVPQQAFRPDAIAAFLRRVGSARGVTFVREGRDYPPAAAAQFLRARRAQLRKQEPTLARFLELASKSSRTGEPYHVRLEDGTLMPAKQWFDELLREPEGSGR